MSTLMLSVSGCRGIVGRSLTPEVVARYAGAFAGYVRERAGARRVLVVMGRDGRRGGTMVRDAAAAGLCAGGCDVLDLGVAMTPTTAVMTDEAARANPERLVAGMVLTASHNPQEWNGLKCLDTSRAPSREDFGSRACAPEAALAEAIIERFRSGRVGAASWEELGSAAHDALGAPTHVARVASAMEACGLTPDAGAIGAGLGVCVDSVNASGAEGARRMIEALGCARLVHLNADASGVFPHPPEPTRENLAGAGGLAEAVVEHRCAVGFAQDPDADRLALIDESGRYVGEEYTLALSCLALLEAERALGRTTNGATLVTNLSTSRMLDDVAAGFGARVLRTAVGEANVVEVMKREGALAGGEGNGGIIWPRVAYVRDSLSGMALVLALLSGRGGKRRRLSEVIATLPAYAIEKRKVSLARREDATPAVEAVARANAGERVDLQDGVRVDFSSRRAWLHVRASNTEPIMRLIAEAPARDEALAILDQAQATIARG